MKRSDFLAIIPALSSLPLIGKEIIQKPDKIEIYQPEEVKNFTKQIKSADTYLAIVKNGQIMG